jgi:hypothetical protein
MSPPGRPKGESLRPPAEGTPVSLRLQRMQRRSLCVTSFRNVAALRAPATYRAGSTSCRPPGLACVARGHPHDAEATGFGIL